MPEVFRSHPFLTSGATTIDPKGKVVPAGLYLDGNGPHPINSFGCTICHGGQGSGTDFTYASHTPDSLKEAEEWDEEYDWHEFHFWDFPMLPKRFIESSCLKCHHRGHRRPAGQEAAGGLPADRQVRLHRLPHDRRRGLVRPGPDRRAAGRPEPLARRLQGRQGMGPQVDHRSRTPSGPIRGCRGSTA